MANNTYVISDIHGQYDAFTRMIEKINFTYDDEMYILGDIIDRGNKSLECVKWIMEQDNILSLLGNHELLFLDNYLHNAQGIYNTIEEARSTLSDFEIKNIVDWISNMPECKLVTVNGKRFFLAHTQAINAEYFKEELTDRMFPEYSKYNDYYNYKNKEIISIFGHIPTIQMRLWNNQDKDNSIWTNVDKSIYDIDCGAGYPDKGGCLGCMRLNDFTKFYVSI